MAKRNKNQGETETTTIVERVQELSIEEKRTRLVSLTSAYRASLEASKEAADLTEKAKQAGSTALRSLVEEFGANGQLTLDIDGQMCVVGHRNDLYFVKSPKGQSNMIKI